jgi:mono/diheme cytochrome c family protein
LTARQKLSTVALTVFTVSVVAWTGSSATASPTVPTTKNASAVGRVIYRRYCGQCHALAQALSAGFGNNTKGIGRNGGPSFNDLRVPYAASVTAVTEPTGGHEDVRTTIAPKQLIEVAAYIARTTINNPIPAWSTDG